MIGVVVPCLDGERYLGEAIDSILGQTVAPAQVVLVDDGSTDGSAALARERGVPVTATARPRSGTGAARQVGADLLQTPLLAFLDADDRWTPRKLERQLAVLEGDPTVDAVIGGVRQFVSPDRASELDGRVAFGPSTPEAWSWGAMLIRREALERAGGCDQGVGMAETVDFFRRAREHLRFAVVDEVVLERRVHGGNATLRDSATLRADYLRAARAAILSRRGERS